MHVRVAKWGNSLAIRLPKVAVEKLSLQAGTPVDLSIEDDRIEIRASRPHYRLEDLLAQITPDSVPEAVEFPPAGKEAL